LDAEAAKHTDMVNERCEDFVSSVVNWMACGFHSEEAKKVQRRE